MVLLDQPDISANKGNISHPVSQAPSEGAPPLPAFLPLEGIAPSVKQAALELVGG